MRSHRRVGWLFLLWVPVALGSGSGCGDESSYAGPCVEERDDGDDGTVEQRTRYTYERGRLVLVEFDDDADDDLDSVWVFEYEGGVLRREVDGDAPDGANGTEMLYDAEGFLVQLGYDDDGDALGDRGHTYENDAEGNLLTHDHFDDFGGDPTWRDTHTYDEDGYLVRKDHDRDVDGAVDDVTTYLWSSDHTDLRVEEDRGQDEVVDAISHFTYDEDENVLVEELDWDGDEEWDRRDVHSYQDGLLSRTETDEGADGVLDAVQIYQYDGQGRRTLAAYYDGFQTPLMRIYSTYDDRGNLLQKESQDGVGAILAVTRYDYGCWR